MSTIVDREYVKNEKHRFFPTPSGWLLTAFLTKYFADIVDVNFTAKTEDSLDDVSNGELVRSKALNEFWNAFSPLVKTAAGISNPDVMTAVNDALQKHLFPDGNTKCPECKNGELSLKVSKYGAFLACSNYPECKYTRDLSKETIGADGETKPAGNGPIELGDGITFRIGKFGAYVSDGKKNASAKKYNADTITLDVARELLDGVGKKAEGTELGINPATGKPILYFATGRYGAYISSNKVNVSVKQEPDLETAADLINNKKPSAKKSWGRKK